MDKSEQKLPIIKMGSYENPFQFLSDLFTSKKETGAFGATEIKIVWENGQAKLLDVQEKGTLKFPTTRPS